MRQNTFGQSMLRDGPPGDTFRTIRFSLEVPRSGELLLPAGRFQRFPYVPADPGRRDERCEEVYEIQVQGLTKRLEFTGIDKPVIGISGGLDSTQALLVCAQAMDRLGRPRSNILAYTMPGFATGDRTLAQARQLMQAVGCSAHELDIRPACLQMVKDIGHPFANGPPGDHGTFELKDFNLYYTLRFGYPPPRVAFLEYCAWHAREEGVWPDVPSEHRRQYAISDIKRHLGTFLYRFFQLSQFKRSAIPNAPKVGSGGSLSPRGDYRAPSDGEAAAWLAQLDLIPETV